MSNRNSKEAIQTGSVYLGIEMGSTRIKAVLVDESCAPIASGSHDWENRLEDGVWTYHLDDVWAGLQDSYSKLRQNVKEKYNTDLTKLKGMGVSAMMHGYLVFDKQDNQLVPFRTWRNTSTEKAAEILTRDFNFNIPQRWSIAHLYQAILNGESHVADIDFMTTLAGYVHWQLTGKKLLGVGEACGMFPLEDDSLAYNTKMLAAFDKLISDKRYAWSIKDIMPEILTAGDVAGTLTPQGAKRLDPTGTLVPGCPLCPPEGDAGTGMVATNSVSERTGNVSAGTSIFAMVVLEKPLSKVHMEIDMVTTPSGKPVAMAHCNSCTSDLDAWIRLLKEFNGMMGTEVSTPALYDTFYGKALEGDPDCGGLLSYNYYSGEPVTGLEEGRPLFVRMPDSKFTFANFARCILYSTMATLKIGMDILTEQEHVKLEQLLGHGGLFKTEGVGQTLMAGALKVPVTVMETAGEGGAWGIALLAAFTGMKQSSETLEDFLANRVFADSPGTCIKPAQTDVDGFSSYIAFYKKGLAVQKSAVANLR